MKKKKINQALVLTRIVCDLNHIVDELLKMTKELAEEAGIKTKEFQNDTARRNKN